MTLGQTNKPTACINGCDDSRKDFRFTIYFCKCIEWVDSEWETANSFKSKLYATGGKHHMYTVLFTVNQKKNY